MATSKLILVLASSVRRAPSTCVAGRELFPGPAGYAIGPWVRPVSNHGEGELYPRETRMFGGHQPRVLDVLRIPLTACCRDPIQPENWRISTWGRWKRVASSIPKPPISALIERPRDLWLEPGQKADRVSAAFAKAHRPRQSLRLVVVPRVLIMYDWNPHNPLKKRHRVRFHYNGQDYLLPLTDPVFTENRRERFPPRGAAQVTFEVAPLGGCVLCVSLASEYNGFHHKIVATILNPRDHARP